MISERDEFGRRKPTAEELADPFSYEVRDAYAFWVRDDRWKVSGFGPLKKYLRDQLGSTNVAFDYYRGKDYEKVYVRDQAIAMQFRMLMDSYCRPVGRNGGPYERVPRAYFWSAVEGGRTLRWWRAGGRIHDFRMPDVEKLVAHGHIDMAEAQKIIAAAGFSVESEARRLLNRDYNTPRRNREDYEVFMRQAARWGRLGFFTKLWAAPVIVEIAKAKPAQSASERQRAAAHKAWATRRARAAVAA